MSCLAWEWLRALISSETLSFVTKQVNYALASLQAHLIDCEVCSVTMTKWYGIEGNFYNLVKSVYGLLSFSVSSTIILKKDLKKEDSNNPNLSPVFT